MPPTTRKAKLQSATEITQEIWTKIRNLHLQHGMSIADLVRRFRPAYGISRQTLSKFIHECRDAAGLPALTTARPSEFCSSAIRSNPNLRTGLEPPRISQQ